MVFTGQRPNPFAEITEKLDTLSRAIQQTSMSNLVANLNEMNREITREAVGNEPPAAVHRSHRTPDNEVIHRIEIRYDARRQYKRN